MTECPLACQGDEWHPLNSPPSVGGVRGGGSHDHVFIPASVLPRQGGGKKRMPRGLSRGASPGCYTGPFEKGESVIAPLREIGTPIADLSASMSWVEAQIQYHIYNPTVRAINLSSYAQGIFPVCHLAPFENFGQPNSVTLD